MAFELFEHFKGELAQAVHSVAECGTRSELLQVVNEVRDIVRARCAADPEPVQKKARVNPSGHIGRRARVALEGLRKQNRLCSFDALAACLDAQDVVVWTSTSAHDLVCLHVLSRFYRRIFAVVVTDLLVSDTDGKRALFVYEVAMLNALLPNLRWLLVAPGGLDTGVSSLTSKVLGMPTAPLHLIVLAPGYDLLSPAMRALREIYKEKLLQVTVRSTYQNVRGWTWNDRLALASFKRVVDVTSGFLSRFELWNEGCQDNAHRCSAFQSTALSPRFIGSLRPEAVAAFALAFEQEVLPRVSPQAIGKAVKDSEEAQARLTCIQAEHWTTNNFVYAHAMLEFISEFASCLSFHARKAHLLRALVNLEPECDAPLLAFLPILDTFGLLDWVGGNWVFVQNTTTVQAKDAELGKSDQDMNCHASMPILKSSSLALPLMRYALAGAVDEEDYHVLQSDPLMAFLALQDCGVDLHSLRKR